MHCLGDLYCRCPVLGQVTGSCGRHAEQCCAILLKDEAAWAWDTIEEDETVEMPLIGPSNPQWHLPKSVDLQQLTVNFDPVI